MIERINSNYTFENFVVDSSNKFAFAATQAVAENLGKVYNPLFIYSGVGLGKTHLLHSIGNYLNLHQPEKKGIYISSEKFINSIIEGVRQGNLSEIQKYYRSLDILLIDDIQFLGEAESTQEEFFHIFNTFYEEKKQIVISSDKPPKKLPGIEERLISRFEWGLICDIKPPSLETRIAILRTKQKTEGLELPDDILLYIAQKFSSNVRELEGVLKRVKVYAKLSGKTIDKKLVEELISDLIPKEEGKISKPAEVVVPPEEGIRKIEIGYFYPSGSENDFNEFSRRIKKILERHRLKLRFDEVFHEEYKVENNMNLQKLTQLAKKTKVKIVIFLSPPSAKFSEDFPYFLEEIFKQEGITLFYFSLSDLRKDYRYLNMILDIASVGYESIFK